jgi:hypothetical protein
MPIGTILRRLKKKLDTLCICLIPLLIKYPEFRKRQEIGLYSQGGRQGVNKERIISDSEAGCWRKTYNPSYSAHRGILREQVERLSQNQSTRKSTGCGSSGIVLSHHAWIPALLHNTAQKGKS